MDWEDDFWLEGGWRTLVFGGVEEMTDTQRVLYIAVAVGLVLLAGLMSGLTLGLMGIDKIDLEVLIRSGSAREKLHAQRIAPILEKPHLLLVTLLLVNAAAMEALPLVLDRLVSPYMAVLLSVTAVLFFGEIIPQALCSRYGLAVGAYSAWLVRLLIVLVGIISYPISKVLDWVLGSEHGALFRRNQLKALVDIHKRGGDFEGGLLTDDEISIIHGALDLASKCASEGMTPLEDVVMVSSDARLDEATMEGLLRTGHSRIPVYRGDNKTDIIGVILVKELALLDPEDAIPVTSLNLRPIPFLHASTAMYDLLHLFQTGRSHMVVLTRHPGEAPESPSVGRRNAHGHARRPVHSSKNVMEAAYLAAMLKTEPVGIITIEDIIEELIGGEILDETDRFVDNLKKERVNAALLVRQLPMNLRDSLYSYAREAAHNPATARSASPPPPSSAPDPDDALDLAEEGFISRRGGKLKRILSADATRRRGRGVHHDARVERAAEMLQPLISYDTRDGQDGVADESRGLLRVPTAADMRLRGAASLLQPFLAPSEED